MTDARKRIAKLEEALNELRASCGTLLYEYDAGAVDDQTLQDCDDKCALAASLLEQKETDQDSLHVDETCKENRESFACSETGEREAAMDQLLKDDGELYDEKAKSWYSLGNALRGHIHGWFSSDEEAWDALRASFNERFPSDSGRTVYLTKELFIANSSAGYPDTPPHTHGDVERVAKAISPYLQRSYSGTNPDVDDQARGRDTALHVAGLAISAMHPVSVDREKLQEIRWRLKHIQAWHEEDSLKIVLSQDAAWQACNHRKWLLDTLLSAIEGGSDDAD